MSKSEISAKSNVEAKKDSSAWYNNSFQLAWWNQLQSHFHWKCCGGVQGNIKDISRSTNKLAHALSSPKEKDYKSSLHTDNNALSSSTLWWKGIVCKLIYKHSSWSQDMSHKGITLFAFSFLRQLSKER